MPAREFLYSNNLDHEIFSTVILSPPLIQEGQWSVSGEKCLQKLVSRLEDNACPGKAWLGKLARHGLNSVD